VIEDGKILFDQNVEAITQKLSFRFAYDDAEVREALYSEASLKGAVIVTPNTGSEETKLDLELLYKAIIADSTRITNLFQS
jgi:ABC-2 type transport system ATP-binding protein